MLSRPRKLSLVSALGMALASLFSPLVAASGARGGAGLPASAAGSASTGGAPILSGGLAPTGGPQPVPNPPGKRARGQWVRGVTVTEYWPAPESWFVGRLVAAPGLPGLHRIDWLYSATGLSMEGEGIGLDGQLYHIQSLGDGGWVTASGPLHRPRQRLAGAAPLLARGRLLAQPPGGR